MKDCCLNYLFFQIVDTFSMKNDSNPKSDNFVENDKSTSDVVVTDLIKSYQDEIVDLKSRLSASTEDRLNYYNKIRELEEHCNELKDKFNNELNSNKAIMKENRDLILSTENQKATNSALIKRLDSLKNDLEKFKIISNLQNPNTSEIKDIATMVENMTSDEKIRFLMNRLVDLNGIVNELKDANESLINERDRIDKLYKNLKIAIRENLQLMRQNPRDDENGKSELPGIENEMSAEFVYDKRIMMEKVLNKNTDELHSFKSTPKNSISSAIKNAMSTPEKCYTATSNHASETNIGNDPKNPGLNSIIRKMKTIKNGATPPNRYKPQTTVKPVRTPEQAVLKGLCNTPDVLSMKSESYLTTPVRYNKARVIRRTKHNGDANRNEKTSKIHNFFKQTKDDAW
ncbi:hypothetical protein MACJ_003035 [Theileria orientalis]|uniref:Uncharacterized protein n=1 Tax=Theileria orientalis TaxID=68886 RepID=A0A976M785_THEOR|nr:hypothetical protein MACJ_003035 [Theileria orientalis]